MPEDPVVVDRRKVDLRPAEHAFPFHAAMDAEPEERDAVIAAGLAAAEDVARDALRDLVAELDIAAGGVIIGRGVRKMPIEKIIVSAQLFHSAEGEVIQHGLRVALVDLGLPLSTVTFANAEAHDAWPIVSDLGRPLGPPWKKDQKLAAVAAWVAASQSQS